jgi:uncharacterized metal-binding protein YceD (DUF177 family)
MDSSFKISLDLLQEGEELLINETLSSDFLDIHEEELQFEDRVSVQAKASLAGDQLLLDVSVQCTAYLPCAICNEKIPFPLFLNHRLITQEIKETKNRLIDCTEELRQSILLEVPQFTECHGGSCPERKNMECYCKKSSEKKIPEYFPFEKLK